MGAGIHQLRTGWEKARRRRVVEVGRDGAQSQGTLTVDKSSDQDVVKGKGRRQSLWAVRELGEQNQE